MPTEADFGYPVVTEQWVEVEFKTTNSRFRFDRMGRTLSPDKPRIEHNPVYSTPAFRRFPEWELCWLARVVAQRGLSELAASIDDAASAGDLFMLAS